MECTSYYGWGQLLELVALLMIMAKKKRQKNKKEISKDTNEDVMLPLDETEGWLSMFQSGLSVVFLDLLRMAITREHRDSWQLLF